MPNNPFQPQQPQYMPYQNQPQTFISADRPAMTYDAPINPLIQTMAQKNRESIDNKPEQEKKSPIIPIIIGAAALVIVAAIIIVIVLFGGDKRSIEIADNDTDSTVDINVADDTEERTSSSYSTADDDYEVFNIGETWTVDGQWSLTIIGVNKTDERNSYSKKNPEVVYIVDYVYTNIGYEDDIMDGVFFSLDDTIVDSKGASGYSYLGNISEYAQEAPLGATCKAQACIGLDHDGTFKISMAKYDDETHVHKASFVIDPTKEAYEYELPSVETEEIPALAIGETWTVDGQWSVTVTGVRKAERLNKYCDKSPEEVYMVEYTYTNIGYKDDLMDGLYITLDDVIVDSKGMMGFSYPGDIKDYPKPIQIGETLKAESCVGVYHAGDFKVTISKYDGNKNKQKETFAIKVN
jgi:Telomeric repeat-binding factor 2.